MTALLIKAGRVFDPALGTDLRLANVLVRDGRLEAAGRDLSAPDADVIDARGFIVCPGFVDLHAHLREPGFEYKETIETGTAAAARGGFTTVCAMPNTEPPMDSRATVDFVMSQARVGGAVRVLPIGCVTKGRLGSQLAELGELAAAGCIAFSDDGSPVADAGIMRRALEYAGAFSLAVIDHCEDGALAAGGVMHEGWVSTRLGLKGYPSASEDSMIARDIALARQTGGHVHIAHVSTAGGIELVRGAKAEGLAVTAEVTPHHLCLTHERVMSRPGAAPLAYDTNAKMYPPLRDQTDVDACIAGLVDGTIDAIATDHAPHAIQDKLCEFDAAANGIVGLETAFGLIATLAVGRLGLTLERVLTALTVGPVRALSLDRAVPGLGSFAPGAPADVILLDPDSSWTVDPAAFASKGRNTPLAGAELRGRVVATIFGGELVFDQRGVTARG